MEASLSSSTFQTYSTALARVRRLGVEPPFTRDAVLALLERAASEDVPWGSVQLMRAAVAKFNSLRGEDNPFEDPVVATVVAGFKRRDKNRRATRPQETETRAAAPARAAAIDALLRRALDQRRDQQDRRLDAALVVGFVFCLRPKTLCNINPEHIIVEEGDFTVRLVHEKTGSRYDQHRSIHFSAPRGQPLGDLLRSLASSFPRDQPLWPTSDKAELVRRLREAHHPRDNNISLNSLRPGGASCAYRFASREAVMHLGNWTSSAVDRYLRDGYARPQHGSLLEDACLAALGRLAPQ